MSLTGPAEVVLIDLSSIAYPIWHMSQADPDPNKACQSIVARVRALANDHPHVAICCDSGRSFRHDVSGAYKANRPEHEATLHHQITLAKEQLAGDGFPIWSVRSFEADDLIATATITALGEPDVTVLIVSADKDLLQLVSPRVKAKSVRDGSILDAAAVADKFGVQPGQIRDYLTLVGDKSDNIRGAAGIGEKKAAALLATFGSLDAVYAGLADGTAAVADSIRKSLLDFQPHLETTRQLVTLRTDVDLPFDEIAAARVPKEIATFTPMEEDADMEPETPAFAMTTENQPPAEVPAPTGLTLASSVPEVFSAPAEWERQLDPRSLKDARIVAKDLFESRMFSAYGMPQGVLSTIMVGRELGLPAMASLRSIHVIEGKHSLAASLMVALVLKSGLAEYFEPIAFSADEATYETHRKGARNPVRLTHTLAMAQQAWPKKKDWDLAFQASGWGRNPTDMLVARATSRLARMVYPDLLAGLYTPEELIEVREAAAAA